MGDRRSVDVWPLGAIQAASLILAEWNYRRLTAPPSSEALSAGTVSIVIPARNEAQRLPQLLRSLHGLRYRPIEVIVVDDGSSDETQEVAHAEGCTVIEVDHLPPGWTGKSRACLVGAGAARGDWLLFTDADTVHDPRSLGIALQLAFESDAQIVSFLAQQRCVTLWERLVLPYAYALYFVGMLHPNNGRGPSVANGQYMLCKRSTYWSVGGHASVRSSIVEDVALADVVRDRGGKVVLARGEDLLSVRMYDDLRSLWEGFSKNAFRFLLASPRTGMLPVIASIAISTSGPRALRAGSYRGALLILALPAFGLIPWYRRFRVPVRCALLYPFTASVFGLLALDSIRRTVWPGTTVWRGRRY
jgi:chlorobactene glucosyltransferase